MWGFGEDSSIGIIPANTGRIIHALTHVYHFTDHPREYGENDAGWTVDNVMEGSSPRIRGELYRS